jgi:hypothetical protein
LGLTVKELYDRIVESQNGYTHLSCVGNGKYYGRKAGEKEVSVVCARRWQLIGF